MRVRYHPEDLSRVYVSADGRHYVEARYADVRRPSISLWEQRAAMRAVRAAGQPRLSEALVFQAIGKQRQIVEGARRQTRRTRAGKPPSEALAPPEARPPPDLDYSKPAEPFDVEMWE